MTSAPLTTIFIQVGDVFIIDSRSMSSNFDSFNATRRGKFIVPLLENNREKKLESTHYASHNPSPEDIHSDSPASGMLHIADMGLELTRMGQPRYKFA